MEPGGEERAQFCYRKALNSRAIFGTVTKCSTINPVSTVGV
jgi:hypothetical protein